MGSISRVSRSERFIEEFNEDAQRICGMSEFIESEGPGTLSVGENETVRYYVTFRHADREERLVMESVFFEPDCMDEDLIASVCGFFQLEENEAIRRLLKAELISKEEWAEDE